MPISGNIDVIPAPTPPIILPINVPIASPTFANASAPFPISQLTPGIWVIPPTTVNTPTRAVTTAPKDKIPFNANGAKPDNFPRTTNNPVISPTPIVVLTIVSKSNWANLSNAPLNKLTIKSTTASINSGRCKLIPFIKPINILTILSVIDCIFPATVFNTSSMIVTTVSANCGITRLAPSNRAINILTPASTNLGAHSPK